MDVAIYAKEVWHNLNLSSLFGDGRQVIDQFKWYIEQGQSEKGFLELNEEQLSVLREDRVSSLVRSVPIDQISTDSLYQYYDRRINVSKDISLINLDLSYYMSQNYSDSMEVNLNIDKFGVMEVMYEDGTLVEIGQLPKDSRYFSSRFHCHMIEVNGHVGLIIDDIFAFQGSFLATTIFANRVKLLREVDFFGDYQYCTIIQKRFTLVSGKSLLESIGNEREFVSVNHLVNQYFGAYLFSDSFKQVVFCSHDKVFSIEWTDVPEVNSMESELAKAVKRVQKQKYPILQFIFNARKSRYRLFKVQDNDGGKICLWFHDEFMMIKRRMKDFSSVFELLHSIFVELVCQYAVCNGEIISLNNSFQEVITIVNAYYSNIRSRAQVIGLSRLPYRINDSRLNGRFLLCSFSKLGCKILHDLSRVRIKNVSHPMISLERFSEPGKDGGEEPPDLLEVKYEDSVFRLFESWNPEQNY